MNRRGYIPAARWATRPTVSSATYDRVAQRVDTLETVLDRRDAELVGLQTQLTSANTEITNLKMELAAMRVRFGVR